MATTYTLISSNTVSVATTSVTFSSIPSTYTDLVLVGSSRTEGGSWVAAYLQINLNNGSNYSFTRLRGNGSAASSQRSAASTPDVGGQGGYPDYVGATANTFDNFEIYVPNYLVSANKQISWYGVSENNTSTAYQSANALLYSNTTAISSLRLGVSDGSNWAVGSSFYLYGIKNS